MLYEVITVAHLALPNSTLELRGMPHRPLQSPLLPDHQALYLFPEADAPELSREVLRELGAPERPIQLVVPDGSWRQTRSIIV